MDALPTIKPVFEDVEALGCALAAVLGTGRVANDGPFARAFEHALAEHLGVPSVAAVSSGFDALLLGMEAVGGRGVAILPSFTYVATLNAVERAGFHAVFCDIEPDTWTMSPTALERILDQRDDVSLVVPVNVYGVPPDLPAICEIAGASGAAVVFDNAHGFGTEVHGKRHTPGPDVVTFSFHATKTLPAVEGGAVVADEHILEQVRRQRAHGIAGSLAAGCGVNAKLDEVRAVIGLHNLDRFTEAQERRATYSKRLRAAASAAGFVVQRVPSGVVSSCQNLAILCGPGDRARVIDKLGLHGVEGRKYFAPALHRLDRDAEWGPLPVTEDVASRVLCVPLWDRMAEEDLTRICGALMAAKNSTGVDGASERLLESCSVLR